MDARTKSVQHDVDEILWNLIIWRKVDLIVFLLYGSHLALDSLPILCESSSRKAARKAGGDGVKNDCRICGYSLPRVCRMLRSTCRNLQVSSVTRGPHENVVVR